MIYAAKLNMFPGFLQWGFCEAKQESCKLHLFPPEREKAEGTVGLLALPLAFSWFTASWILAPVTLWGSPQAQTPTEEELLWRKPGFQPGMQDSWWRSNLGWGRHSQLDTGLTWWWANIFCRRTLLQPDQGPSGSSEQTEILLLVLSTALMWHIFQFIQSLFHDKRNFLWTKRFLSPREEIVSIINSPGHVWGLLLTKEENYY